MSQVKEAADQGAMRPPVRRVTVRIRSLPDAVLVLMWYFLTRVWGVYLLFKAAAEQQPSVWTGPNASYDDMAQMWDAQWYKIIAESGYPLPLPVDEFGVVQQNPWAFFPGFPFTVKILMAVTGSPFAPAAVVLNLILGGCAMVVVARLVRRFAGRRAGLGCVMLLCAMPAAPTFQIGYSESLALLLLALALEALARRRYAWCAVVVLALALTRPIVAPLALVMFMHLLVRYRAWFGVLQWGDRPRELFSARDQFTVIGLGLFTAASSLLWPMLAGFFAGSTDAYERTQAAWRSGGVVSPFRQSVGIAEYLWGPNGGWWLLAGGVALMALLWSPWGRRMGPELTAWSFAYPLYLVAITEPWTSTFRYLLMVFPVLAIVSIVVRFRVVVVALAFIGLWGQTVWVHHLLVLSPPADFPP
ncbi:MAG: hypothetical protein ACRCTR_05580 [Actinomycetota bacterium]